jgi:hypothetical protein
VTRYKFGSPGYETCSPSNWGSTYFSSHNSSQATMVYAPEIDCIIWLNTSYALAVTTGVNAGTNLPAVSSPPVSGTGNRPSSVTAERFGATWCKDLGSFGAIVCWDYRTNLVHACYAPSNPTSGTWTWAVLSSSNTPSPGDAIWWYNRFQYAPALKSFFLCSMPTDSYGGIVCFRPSEIP